MSQQIHNVPAEDVYTLLHSRADGLNDQEVEARIREVGLISLESRTEFRWLQSLLRHFTNFFSLLLDISAALCFIAEHIQPGQGMAVLGWALLGVSVLNSLFAFAQEYRAERAVEELKKFLPPQARVRRETTEITTLVERIVPGDVLLVSEGDQIPADARLVESHGLLVSNAPLTGESRSLALKAEADDQERLIDSANVILAGCSVMSGSGSRWCSPQDAAPNSEKSMPFLRTYGARPLRLNGKHREWCAY